MRRHALKDLLLVLRVLQIHADKRMLLGIFHHFIIGDKAFRLQNPDDRHLQARRRDVHLLKEAAAAVMNAM